MMSPPETNEADMLEDLLPRYQAEGFEVFLHPSPSILPPFMQSYRPDAVALRSDKKIAIEVIRSSGASAEKMRKLESLFAPHKDWELRVLYVSPLPSEKIRPSPPPSRRHDSATAATHTEDQPGRAKASAQPQLCTVSVHSQLQNRPQPPPCLTRQVRPLVKSSRSARSIVCCRLKR